jgi:hypothetical protein
MPHCGCGILKREDHSEASYALYELQHSAPILAAATNQNRDRLLVLVSCSDGTLWTWALSSRHSLSKESFSRGTAVTAIAFLGSDRAVYAAGGTLFVGHASQNFVPL